MPGLRRWTVLSVTAIVCAVTAPVAGVVAWHHMVSTTSLSTDADARAARQVDPGSWKYVALGDSYTAGPFIPFVNLTSGACLRSSNNYPHVLATWFATSDLTDVSCSGAQTAAMTSPQQTFTGVVRAQFDALSADTDLVTLGIGGNDFGLFGSITSTCPRLKDSDPAGYPCRRHFTVSGVDTLLRDARSIGARVGAVVSDIRERSPHARILVLGYPRITSAQGSCQAQFLADGDSRWANRVEVMLNSSIRRAVTAHGGRYVDLYPSTRGHSACAGDRAWVNGPVTDPFRAVAYHPFFSGMLNDAVQAYRSIFHRAPSASQLEQARVTARQNQAAARMYAHPAHR
jgi:lysophospholipase L1-like esterase